MPRRPMRFALWYRFCIASVGCGEVDQIGSALGWYRTECPVSKRRRSPGLFIALSFLRLLLVDLAFTFLLVCRWLRAWRHRGRGGSSIVCHMSSTYPERADHFRLTRCWFPRVVHQRLVVYIANRMGPLGQWCSRVEMALGAMKMMKKMKMM